jgi:exodeoxyribonuclease V alpha subunit
MDDGHCGLPTEELVPLTIELLEVSIELVRTALDLELSEGTVIAATVGATACVFLGGLYRAEQVIAERLLLLANGKLPWPYIDPYKALPWVEQQTGLSWAKSQIDAIRLALISKILVITGGPGVGKTTIVNAILRILDAKGVNLLLCAPTGRAAKRMTEATGFEAKTIHRLLEIDPKAGGFKRNSENPLHCDLMVVVDETSMVDVMLMQGLMKAVPDKGRVADRRRYRPAPVRRPRSDPRGRHSLRRGAGCAADRGVPTGRPKQDHHHRPPDQSRLHSRPLQARW